MARLLHVAIGFVGRPVKFTDVQAIFGTAGWARYAPNCWIVSTDEAPQALAERVRTICSEKDSIFVCELNAHNNGGYLQKEIWEWLNSQL